VIAATVSQATLDVCIIGFDSPPARTPDEVINISARLLKLGGTLYLQEPVALEDGDGSSILRMETSLKSTLRLVGYIDVTSKV